MNLVLHTTDKWWITGERTVCVTKSVRPFLCWNFWFIFQQISGLILDVIGKYRVTQIFLRLFPEDWLYIYFFHNHVHMSNLRRVLIFSCCYILQHWIYSKCIVLLFFHRSKHFISLYYKELFIKLFFKSPFNFFRTFIHSYMFIVILFQNY